MSLTINLPRILRIGGGARLELPDVLRSLGLAKPLLVIDEFMVLQGHASTMSKALADQGMSLRVFSGVVPDPTTESVGAGLEALRSDDHDCVIALGGGSAIDTAKLVAVMARREGRLRDYKVPNTLDDGLPVIAIPTTAGTGSEATRAAVVTDSETQEKMLCMGLGLVPVAALVDYELTLSMPYRLTADTGLDSLCHALEAYVSRQSNRFTDGVALAAMAIIASTLRTACAEPDNLAAREAMMLAATQGGIAFSNASVTLIHGMSRPIGAHFHVPHGLSNAMLLPTVTAWSIGSAPARYADCARAMALATATDSNDTACIKLVDGLRALCADLSVPGPQAYGISRDKWAPVLDLMAEQALASGSPANNPRVPALGEIIELYEAVWAA
ncbi:MAG: alcohol dehydrogenase class IV [Bermanella sp.]|jgi:alcohol dehydrogenase class IV